MLNYRKHNFWKALVNFISQSDEKVASSLKHNQTPNANMADHSVGARDELHETEVS